ncbi:MAG TPA: DinB family protein [Bryobacteraceae bacterium]|nr:DinB family protein [Bryobacteraceae bacterium]
MRPQPDEYNASYHQYILRVPDDVRGALASQIEETVGLLSAADGEYRYAPGKWTIGEMLGHVIDSERIFAYRALRIARNDPKPMEGFEQDDYVRNAPHPPLAGLIEEFKIVRQSTNLLFRHLDAEAWSRRGVANQSPVTVRALAFLIAGHELHHRSVLKQKYLTMAIPEPSR